MARTPRDHWTRNHSWLAALRSAAVGWREGELEVPRPDSVLAGVPDAGPPPPPAPDPVPLRQGGAWTVLHTAPGAAADSITRASTLATELGRISGSTAPSRVTWDGSSPGVRVGLASEWVAAGVTLPTGTWGTWDWALVTIAGQPYVLGRTSRGLQVAIRRLAHALGLRRLTTLWEILPTVPATVISVADEVRALDYSFFNLGISLLTPGAATTRSTDWTTANALVNDGSWTYGHAYAAIIAADPTAFAAHPEWTGGGLTNTTAQMCAFEPGLQAEVVEYVRHLFATNANRRAVSVSAADGSAGWTLACTGTGEHATQTPSDRQLKLANVVQAALTSDGLGQRAAIIVYADTSRPPTLAVDPDLLIVWTTAFMQGGLSAEQVRDAYLAQGGVLHAPYSYYSEWPWDFDIGPARATSRDQLSVEADRLAGAIGSAAECSAAWVPFGRFYWALAAINVGDDPLARWDAWPALAFPSATALATAFYDVLGTDAPLSSDLVHRLAQAAKDLIAALPVGSAEQERALDLARYVNYLALYRAYKASPSATTFEPLLQWNYRIRNRDVTTYMGFYAVNTYSTDRKAVAAKYGLSDLTYTNTIWPDTATTLAEINGILTTLIATNALLPFTPVGFSLTDLVRVSNLVHASTIAGSFVEQTKDQEWWYHASGSDIFTFKGGVVWLTKGPCHVRIYEFASGETVWEQDIPEDRVSRDTASGYYPPVVTKAQQLYKIAVTKATPGLTWSWNAGAGVNFQATDDVSIFTAGYSGYVYVPQGTTVIGFFAGSGTVRWFSADNVQRGQVTAANDYYSVTVPEGHDGEVWKFTGAVGKMRPYTIPTNVALREAELLIPRSVVEADGLVPADATPPPTPTYPVLSFSSTLVRPAVPLTGTGARGSFNYMGTDTAGTEPIILVGIGSPQDFTIDAGVVSAARGDSVVTVTDLTTSTVAATWQSAPDRVVRTFTFTGVAGRRYRLDVDVNGGCKMTWPVGAYVEIKTLGTSQLHMPFTSGFNGWFYVPKGTTHVELWADGGRIKFYDDKAKLITTISAAQGYYSFAVPAGKAGTCMRFTGAVGRIGFTSVPPWFALDPSGIAVPAEVAAADGL